MVGVGFTVILKLVLLPAQVFAVGVTVTVAVTGALVALVAVNEGILPFAVVPKPISVLHVHE